MALKETLIKAHRPLEDLECKMSLLLHLCRENQFHKLTDYQKWDSAASGQKLKKDSTKALIIQMQEV